MASRTPADISRPEPNANRAPRRLASGAPQAASGRSALPAPAPGSTAVGRDRLLLFFEIVLSVCLAGVVLFSGWVIWLMVQPAPGLLRAAPATATPPPVASLPIQPAGQAAPLVLLPLVQNNRPPEPQLPAAEPATGIEIPVIGVDAPVVLGDGWQELMRGVGQHPNGSQPGRPGNLVLSAHNDIFGAAFRLLDRLQPGDVVTLTGAAARYRYVVTEVHIVDPEAVEWLSPSEEAVLTLITCTPFLVDTHRVVVRAAYQETVLQ